MFPPLILELTLNYHHNATFLPWDTISFLLFLHFIGRFLLCRVSRKKFLVSVNSTSCSVFRKPFSNFLIQIISQRDPTVCIVNPVPLPADIRANVKLPPIRGLFRPVTEILNFVLCILSPTCTRVRNFYLPVPCFSLRLLAETLNSVSRTVYSSRNWNIPDLDSPVFIRAVPSRNSRSPYRDLCTSRCVLELELIYFFPGFRSVILSGFFVEFPCKLHISFCILKPVLKYFCFKFLFALLGDSSAKLRAGTASRITRSTFKKSEILPPNWNTSSLEILLFFVLRRSSFTVARVLVILFLVVPFASEYPRSGPLCRTFARYCALHGRLSLYIGLRVQNQIKAGKTTTPRVSELFSTHRM